MPTSCEPNLVHKYVLNVLDGVADILNRFDILLQQLLFDEILAPV